MKDQPLFFSVSHIIKPFNTKLIYGVKYNDLDYFLLKTPGSSDCEQLDSNEHLNPEVFEKMCQVLTEVEKQYKKTPPLEYINIDVSNILFKRDYTEVSKKPQ